MKKDSSSNRLEPNIRFPKFNSNWQAVELKSISNRVTRKNNNQTDIPLTISSQEGLIDQRDFFGKTIASKDMKNYLLLQKGEFAYNKSYSNGYPVGSIKRLDKYPQGALSTLYICFSLEDSVDSDFMQQYFDSDKWYKAVNDICAEGARNHGLLNISANDFFDTIHILPGRIEEQEQIAGILQKTSKSLEIQYNLLASLKKYKRGLLQALFPANGETVPKVRFPGFTDAWEQHKLESLCDVFTDGDWIEAKDQSESGIRLVQTGNVGTTEYLDKENNKKWISEETFEKLHCEEIYEGDILISRLPEPAGRACIMPDIGTRMITAVDCTIVRTRKEYDSKYLVQYLSTPMYFKRVNSFLGGGTRQRISRGNLSGINIPIPSTIEEQKKIGEYLSNLDNLVTLHQNQYEAMKKYKAGLLQQMFI